MVPTERLARRTGSAAAMAAALSLFASLAGAPASAQAVPGYCEPPNKIDWPASNPVWSLCWYAPDQTDLVDGAGLELRHVFYKGKRVFWHATLPVLNVLYEGGPCLGSLSFRDWQRDLVGFDANNVVAPNYAEPTVPPVTACDHPGSDSGSFTGVAAEKLSDRLILTTQMRAGWYRYIQKWTFHLDGRIEPRLGFSAVEHPCTALAHTHHAYWRLDFDIDGAASDRIREHRRFLFFRYKWFTRTTEAERVRGRGRRWQVLDRNTGRGYEVIPRPPDGIADSWAVADLWLLRYHGDEQDDGGATLEPMGDAIHVSPYVNGETIDGQDVVLWYRVGHRHAGMPNCGDLEGPTLRPIGAW